MKVLQVANFVSPQSGGLRTAIDSLRDGYEREGWEVFRLTPFPNPMRPGEIANVKSVRVPTMGSYRVIVERRKVRQIISSIRPDIVELSDKSTLSWIAKWCAREGIACCVISHERMDLTTKSTLLARVGLSHAVRRWRENLAKYSTRVVCASRFAAEEFLATDANIHIIPLGVECEGIEVNRHVQAESSTISVAICSRLSPEKQPSLGLEAARVLSDRYNVNVRVLGDGPLRKSLEMQAKGMNVEFLGHVQSRSQVFEELGKADVVLNLGALETFGLVTLEALATGTPVVVVNTGASGELLADGCGKVAESSSRAVAKAIETVMRERSDSTPEVCRARAEQFSWDRTVSAFSDLYMTLASELCNVG